MIEKSTQQLSTMADSSRLWVFQSSRIITDDLETQISDRLEQFLSNWAAHGSDLFSGFDVRYHRFLLIAVDESKAPATGCSIDGMMGIIQEIDASFDLDLLNRMKVAYWKGDQVIECDVNTFGQMLRSAEVNSSTSVFNNVLQTLGQLESEWQVPVAQSWHANLLP